MRPLTFVAFYAMAIGLILLGGLGLVAPRADFTSQLRIPGLDGLDQVQATTLLVQYRYLKGFALGVGIGALLFRREIFRSARINRLFLLLLSLPALGRLLGLAFDGRPHPAMLPVIAFEVTVPILIYLYTRGQLAEE